MRNVKPFNFYLASISLKENNCEEKMYHLAIEKCQKNLHLKWTYLWKIHFILICFKRVKNVTEQLGNFLDFSPHLLHRILCIKFISSSMSSTALPFSKSKFVIWCLALQKQKVLFCLFLKTLSPQSQKYWKFLIYFFEFQSDTRTDMKR